MSRVEEQFPLFGCEMRDRGRIAPVEAIGLMKGVTGQGGAGGNKVAALTPRFNQRYDLGSAFG